MLADGLLEEIPPCPQTVSFEPQERMLGEIRLVMVVTGDSWCGRPRWGHGKLCRTNLRPTGGYGLHRGHGQVVCGALPLPGRCTWLGVEVSRPAGRGKKAAQDTAVCHGGRVLQDVTAAEPDAAWRGQCLSFPVLGGWGGGRKELRGRSRAPLIIQDAWQGPGGLGSRRSDT